MSERLAKWIRSGESPTLEFKKSTAEKERACRTLCAFANGTGGCVLFGITPAGKAVGQTVNDHTLEELAQETLLHQHESRPWNPLIAQTFYRRGIIETWGRGILKIVRRMRETGLEPPVTTVRSGTVVVTFDVAAALAARGWPVSPQTKSTAEKTLIKTLVETLGKTSDLILATLKSHPQMTLTEVAKLIGKSPSAVERSSAKLVSAGKLRYIGPKKSGYWRVFPESTSRKPR